jgi:hypothetical protein
MLCCFIACTTTAQSVIGSTGLSLKNDTYSIDYSIGELSISIQSTSNNGTINYVSSGVSQPYMKVVNPGCDIINDGLSYFPNPTHDKLSVVGNYNWVTNYVIYDASGHQMANSNFYNNSIDLSRLNAGVYIIILYPGCDNKFKTFKIVKQ